MTTQPTEAQKNDPTLWGSPAWWATNPTLEQRIAYAIETAPEGHLDDGLLGWRPEVEAVLKVIADVLGDAFDRAVGGVSRCE